MEHVWLLAALMFVAAILYSSVGHAGASGYLAAMALMNVAPEVMRPTALCLNIIVATIGTIQFARAGYFAWNIFWPFAVTSVPCAFIGGTLKLPYDYYRAVVGVVLLFAAARLIYSARRSSESEPKPLPLAVALIGGASIGLLAGLTGVGGGIFLSPLLLLANWATVRQTAGVSVAFILVNSIAGLAGNLASVQYLPPQIPFLALTVAVGGIIGSQLGSRHFAPILLRYLLAVVLVMAGCKMIFT
ncbi:MAG TPA: sulfite exporter TauE/SafE family protein [Lacipirellulaceae bacterium]